jgi:hypothetical protein
VRSTYVSISTAVLTLAKYKFPLSIACIFFEIDLIYKKWLMDGLCVETVARDVLIAKV